MAEAERANDEGEAPGKPVKRREELDQLLQRIAAHIAEVDKGDGEPAADASSAATTDAEGASNQQTNAARPDHAKAAQHRDTVAPDRPRAGATLRRSPSSIEPPALRSALGSSGLATPGRGLSGLPVPRRDDGDEPGDGTTSETRVEPAGAGSEPNLVEGVSVRASGGAARSADEPWDDAAAEALTRTYEADLAVPPLRSMLEAMGGPSGGSIERRGSERRLGAAERGHDFGVSASAADVETAQSDLIDAARRVEAMLDRLASREAVDALGARFGTLESEVGRASLQLKRLDGIETRLGELGNKLSDEQVVALFGSLVPTAEDLTHFAEDAAGRAAERVLEAYSQELAVQATPRADVVAGSASASQLKALGELLAAFMDERRRTDAGTLEALETLQLAMQHVLDRIDRVEEVEPIDGRPAGGFPTVPLTPELSVGPTLAAPRSGDLVPDGLVNLTANQGVRGFEAHAYRMPDERTPDLETIPDARGYDETATRAPSLRGRQPDPMAGELDDVPRDVAPRLPGGVASAQQIAGIADAVQPQLSERQAFIAMARKAAERAKNEADIPSKRDADRAAKGRAAKGKSNEAVAGPSVGVIRPGVIAIAVGAIVLALVAGYWLLLGQTGSLPGVLTPTVSEHVEPADRQPSDGAKPDLDGEEATSPADAPPAMEAPAGPSKISNEAPSVPARDQQEAGLTPASDAAGPGMAVAFGQSPATFETVMQARERSRLASLSHRTAFAAARSHAIPQDPVPEAPRNVSDIETASVTPAPTTPQATAPAAIPTAAKEQIQQLILPPAAAGPLSLRLAAAQGDASAQLEIATRLAEGKGVKQSFAEAATWYERAAMQGQPIAQYRLATLYERGMGVKADRGRARSLYEQAAEQGNLKAMHNLAVISASPATGSPDYDTAAALFNRAAGHGLADSQYNLGVLYESGLGVPKDHAAAYKWYTLAARGGDADAARRRDSLISRLPAETLQAMDRQIVAWRPAPADEQANNARVAGNNWQQRKAAAPR